MAELLVMKTDRIGADIYSNAKLPKRGDVIAIQENDWNWGDKELDGSHFIVVKCPTQSISELSGYLSNEMPTQLLGPKETPQSISNTLQFRGFYFDLDHQSIPTGNVITIEDATAFKKIRTTIQNPAVIG
jgi:hypothetical protein